MKNILVDWKNRLKKGHMLSIICVLLIVVAILVAILYQKQREYRQASENSYNMAFSELVDCVQNVETYLAKSLISSTPEHGAETLTHLWREANLAQTYLSRLPIESQELENTEKFLNQVSDYSYSLSRKNIYNESLSEEDLNNMTQQFESMFNDMSENMDFSEYDDILFISKSVGTVVASAYAGMHHLKTRNVYYTPVEASFQFMTQPGIVFTGTADTWVSHKSIRDLCEKGGFPMYVTEDGNHSLETGDVQKDLENLLAIMRTTEGYIALL